MFRRRNSDKKPSEDFLMDFKQNFPHFRLQSNPAIATTHAQDGPNHGYEDLAFDSSDFPDQHESKHYEISPHGFPALEPSFKSPDFLDANHTNDMWPPTPGGPLFNGFHEGAGKESAIYPVSMGMETPISATASNPQSTNSRSQSLTMNDSLYRAATMPTNFNQTQGLAHHAFDFSLSNSHPYSTFTPNLRMSDLSYDTTHHQQHLSLASLQQLTHNNINVEEPLSPQNSSQFRFQVLLKAPTAMVKHRDEIPVTYLNKCQTYAICISDTMAQHDFLNQAPRYRTSIRIAFEDEHQRRRPETCWKLWRDGRGKDEAHKRGGRLQAVEYAKPDTNQGGDQRSNVELATETFDGFSFYWSPGAGGRAECSVQARFNFLSTDFSLSKGVKGVPVRLCAKTEIISTELQQGSPTREICYCSVKTFRDHGSERKLANDRAHVKKLIERATQQMEQAEAGAKANGKRRRSDSIVGERPKKMTTHQRAMSLSSSSSFDGQDLGEDDSRTKLRMLESMPHSIKPVSRLYLKGEEQDDLDTHPVPLLDEPSDPSLLSTGGPPTLRRDSTNTTARSDGLSTPCMPPSHSPSVQLSRHNSAIYPTPPHLPSQKLPGPEHPNQRPSSNLKGSNMKTSPQLASPPPSGSTNVQRPHEDQDVPRIDVSDYNPAYQRPPTPVSRASEAIACFVVKPFLNGERCFDDDSYRATYLMRRDVADLVVAVAEKCGINPEYVSNVLRVNERGVQIKVEDEMIQHLPEAQDMIAEFDTDHDQATLSPQMLRKDEHEQAISLRLTLRF